ncbi:cytochrome d ubiquinol oxidase subunit II [Gordonia sinesedis]
MYVVLDGYDLGIGTLLLFQSRRSDRKTMVEIVATAWDGNESWLILLGVALWGGLPAAYGAMLPAIYLPLVVMLLALIARGVAIEMVSSSSGTPRGWMTAFGLGSLIAAAAQGFAFGGLVSGVRVSDHTFDGGAFDFFTPFSVLTAIATVLMYSVAGAAYLQLKCEQPFSGHFARVGYVLLGITIPVIVVTALWSAATAAPPQFSPTGRAIGFWLLVAVAAVATATAFVGFRRGPDTLAFGSVVVAEIAGLVAFLVGAAPLVVPPDITIADAAAPSGALTFLLIGVGLNIPLVMFYNWYAHHVFRGKYRVPAAERPTGRSQSAAAMRPDGDGRGTLSTGVPPADGRTLAEGESR